MCLAGEGAVLEGGGQSALGKVERDGEAAGLEELWPLASHTSASADSDCRGDSDWCEVSPEWWPGLIEDLSRRVK